MVWRDGHAGQCRGTQSWANLPQVRLSRTFSRPDIAVDERTARVRRVAHPAVGRVESILEVWRSRERLFVFGALGTSLDAAPLPTEEFALGMPFKLGAYDTGELQRARTTTS